MVRKYEKKIKKEIKINKNNYPQLVLQRILSGRKAHIPKSANFILLSLSSKIFSGLRSR